MTRSSFLFVNYIVDNLDNCVFLRSGLFLNLITLSLLLWLLEYPIYFLTFPIKSSTFIFCYKIKFLRFILNRFKDNLIQIHLNSIYFIINILINLIHLLYEVLFTIFNLIWHLCYYFFINDWQKMWKDRLIKKRWHEILWNLFNFFFVVFSTTLKRNWLISWRCI